MKPTIFRPAVLVSAKPAKAVIRPSSATTPVRTSEARATVRALGVRSPPSLTSQTEPASEKRSTSAVSPGGVSVPCTPPAAAVNPAPPTNSRISEASAIRPAKMSRAYATGSLSLLVASVTTRAPRDVGGPINYGVDTYLTLGSIVVRWSAALTTRADSSHAIDSAGRWHRRVPLPARAAQGPAGRRDHRGGEHRGRHHPVRAPGLSGPRHSDVHAGWRHLEGARLGPRGRDLGDQGGTGRVRRGADLVRAR